MDKQVLAIPISLLLLFTSILVPISSFAKADDALTNYPQFYIISPKSTVYHNSTVEVSAVVTKLSDQQYPLITSILYTLNESDIFSYKHANFTFNGLVNLPNNKTGYQYTGNAILEGLKEGNYTLWVNYGYGNTTSGGFSGSSVKFRVVYGDYEPAVLLSPANQTYHSSDVPLSISVNEDYVYAYYCLNGGKPIFINKTSSTLNGLQIGSNNLLVFVKFRDIYSDFKVNFTVDSNKADNSSNISNELIILAVTATAIVLVALIIIIKRKKPHQAGNQISLVKKLSLILVKDC
jgi:hypothetical protein